ncbi:hypothetical protein DICA3_B14092 [Diutina catenulata]
MFRRVLGVVPTMKRFMNTVSMSRPLIMTSFIRPHQFSMIQLQPAHIPTLEPVVEEETDNTVYVDSVMRKRRLKMKKHKLRKRRREQRSLKKRLGKL